MSGWPREDLAVMDFFKTDNVPVSAFTLPADLEADTDQIRELIEFLLSTYEMIMWHKLSPNGFFTIL